MDMNDSDSKLIDAMSEAFSEGTPLGLALATGFLCLLHTLIALLGFVLILLFTLLIGKESFLDDISLISFKSALAWVIGAYAIYLYRTNSTIEKWADRAGGTFVIGQLIFGVVILVGTVVWVLSKFFGFEIPFNIFN